MAGAKEIRTKISSIKSTQKITSAMEMVAASKMRKAQDRMAASRPYAEKMRQAREVRRIGYIIVSSDRGLCGGLNTNLFRRLVREIREEREAGREISYCLVGNKALGFFKRAGLLQARRRGRPRPGHPPGGRARAGVPDRPGEGDARRLHRGRDRRDPARHTLVPLPPGEDAEELKHHWDYIYEPDAREVLDALLTRYIESVAYQAVVENGACEMAARMVAMKSATDNAGNLIDELQLVYNKARQAAITQEISEIVSGAAAVS